MSKLKFKNLLRLIGSLILVVVLALTCVACNEEPGDDGADGSDVTEVITPVRNGEFIYYDDSTNPYTPSSWNFSSSYTVEDEDDTVYVISGVIDTKSENFDKNKATYGITKNPGKVGDDDNVLMINNVSPYSANYKSTAITLEAGKFYKLTLSVKTDLATADNGGANVKLTTSGSREYLSFKSIKSTTWTKYNFFLESTKTSATTVYVSLSLGEGDEGDDETLAKGVAFFDNVVLTEYTDKTDLTAEEQYEHDSSYIENEDWNEDTHATYDFSLPNAEFDNKNVTSSLTSTSTPYDWSTKKGADENGDFQASTSGLTRGVIDVANYVPTKGILKEKINDPNYKITKPAASKGNNVLMIYFTDTKSPSAFAYYSNNITFESEKIYKLSFYIRTLAILDKDGKESDDVGVAVKLGDDLIFEDVNTKGEWIQHSIYVKGSVTKDTARGLYFWLGQGYKGNEADFVSGAAFFDCITLTEVEQYPTTFASNEAGIDLYKPNIITENAFTAESDGAAYVDEAKSWSGEYAENHGTPDDGVVFGAINLNNYANNGQITAQNPGLSSDTRDGSEFALVIDSTKASHYIVNYDNALEVSPNTAYRLSLWVKTEGIDLTKGLKVELIDKSAGQDDATLATLSNINTQYEDDDEDTDTLLNKWEEVVFSVLGHQIDTKSISLRLTLGSGNKYSPDYIKGTVFVSNMYFEETTYTEYSSSSNSDTATSYTFRTESSAPVKNSGFNYVDIDKTSKTDSLVNGVPTLSPAVPANWTGSHVNDLTGDVVSGITNAQVYANVTGRSDFPYESANLDAWSEYNGEPNLLMIYANAPTAYTYVSQSHSLNASSYYKLSAKVKTALISGDAYVTLLSGNRTIKSEPINTSSVSTNDGWTTYAFYVKVGLNSTSVKFQLSLGFDEDAKAEGIVYFDTVHYDQIEAEEYNSAVATEGTIQKVSLSTNSFETTSESFPANPSNFNGGAIQSAPSGSSYTVAGVVSNEHYDVDEMEAEFGETIKAHYEAGKFVGAKNTPEFLIIRNKDKTAYNYVSTNYSFVADTYYKVTFYAKTLALGEGDFAYATLSLTDTEYMTIKIDSTTAVNADANGWAEYTFYVKTSDYDVTDVNITFALGEYEKDDNNSVITEKYATGYAMFDEITIEDIDEEAYTAGKDAIDEDTKNAQYIELQTKEEQETGESEEEPETTPLSTWEIIGIVSGAMLSLALVAVLVTVLIKKLSPRFKAKKTKRFKKPTYDKRKSSTANRDKLNKYKD